MTAWDRRPEEGARAYAAFRLYRDAGPTRSLSAVAREWAGSGSRSRIGEWSRRWHWTIRAAAWDRHVRALEDAEFERETRTRIRVQAAAGAAAVDLAAAALAAADPDDLDPRDAVRVLAEGVRVERLARALPDRYAAEPAPSAVAIAGTDAAGNPYAAAAVAMTDEQRRDRMATLRTELDRRLTEHAKDAAAAAAYRAEETAP